MIEVTENIWNGKEEWLCVTTNGCIKKNKENVMGGGIAKECAVRYPSAPKILGHYLLDSKKIGETENYDVMDPFVCNIVKNAKVFAFPTKYDFADPSDLSLIEKSCKQLLFLWRSFFRPTVSIPRPGCGLGGLDWDKQVKPIVSEILKSDKFYIYHNGK